MIATLMRILALVALLAMPLGMAAEPAAAHSAAMSSGTVAHCDQQPAEPEMPEAPDVQASHCAACAALPAVELSSAGSIQRGEPLAVPLAERFSGIELEIATPPPKNG